MVERDPSREFGMTVKSCLGEWGKKVLSTQCWVLREISWQWAMGSWQWKLVLSAE